MKTPIQVFFVDHSFVALGSWIHERKKTFFLWSRFSLVRVRSVWKCSSPAHNQRMRRSPLSRREGVICWKMDSATSPSALRRMTGWEWKHRFRYSSRIIHLSHFGVESAESKHTNLKGFVAMCIGFWWYWVHCFLIGSCVDYSTKAVLILAFVAPHFNELGFSSIFDLTLMSFCT